MSLVKKYCFLMAYLLVLMPIFALQLGGWLSFIPFMIVFALVPLIDAFIRDTLNPSKEQESVLIKDNFFKYITYAYVPMQLALIAYGAYVVSTHSLSWNEWLGFTMSIGLVTGGVGINLSHEMMHKNSKLQQFLSKTLLVSVCYGHFLIEHVKGHHVRVATPEDPATAQLGESLYDFLPKTITGSFKSAWHLETKRLHRKGISLLNIRNHFWWIITVPVAIASLCFILGGLNALGFFLLQSLVAILTLEIVNYIEHYGLERRKLPNGEYEKVNPYHSWNANHWLSNSILFHLQRHSDHHTYGARPYQVLRHMDQSPQLPSGYLGMMVLALFPPLWKAVMDKRVIEYRKRLKAMQEYQHHCEKEAVAV
ncbi:alkane 1-monooxygenase [Legionella shakespearei]|uniref:Alkane-1-monooxygenase n=1 Tax=Legionella shakespearei DSM 23087 TaxID=1122169 RepID=A0A0W0YZX0_9GAMM|nr:alkane 1-monooxygenase [Legionella shakespearei]KTD62428.1 alkane-1-monooxygenase [Legionella shakespearei DSM 23087]